MTTNKIILEDLQSICQSDLIDWSRFKNKTVLITGANGFLPAYLVESFLYTNYTNASYNIKVVALVRNIQKAQKRFSEYEGNTALEFIVQDVAKKIQVDEKIDFIIHAASQASPKYYGTDPVGTLSANVLGTINLMKLAQEHQVESFLYFSSGEVYGQISDELVPIKEDSFGYINPVNVRSCYAESKRMGENICASWHHQYSVPAKIVRPFHTYGPKMLLDDGRVYADFVSNVLDGSDIKMKSDGSAIRAFCYLADATIGFLCVLLNGVSGEAYNVGNPAEEHSILSLAKKVADLFPSKGIKVVEMAVPNSNEYLKSQIARNSPDTSKIQKLGWWPKISIEEGFKKTIESYSY